MNHVVYDRYAVINILKVIRVHIVVGGFVAFALGTLLAILNGGLFNWFRCALGYLIVFLGDLSTHYSNDYYDAEVEQLSGKKKMFGGAGILLSHPELRPISRVIAIILSLISVSLAAVTVLFYSIPYWFFLVAVAANLLGWSYSAPPIRLSSRGLGETAIAVCTGLVIPGTGYLITKGQLDPQFFLLAIPFMAYGFMLSLSLEAPDMEDDIEVGKNNLVARKGKRFTFFTIMVLSGLATLFFFIDANIITLFEHVDLRVVTIFSFVPLCTGIAGFLGNPVNKKKADSFSGANILALFLFNIFVDAYFIALLF
jgi:1,4-dihydroxy-2-naphthoate octaprenyltransferase